MRRWLGRRGLAGEVARALSTGIARRRWGDPAARRARVVVAQNDDVAARFATSRRVVVEPNAALDPPRPRPSRPSGPPTALFVGRLIGWKGARLALATIAHPLAAPWHLRVYGEGYDRELLERFAEQLQIADRVTFLGHRPRQEVLEAYEEADALLFPSLHDQAGWVVGEASQAGCPVVCLPLGGPPILAGPNGFVASLDGDVVHNLAEQLLLAGERGGQVHARWSRDRLSPLVEDWYADAAGVPPAPPPRSAHPQP
jgi:glycosyltransferase involved in cell wall biosynthesis